MEGFDRRAAAGTRRRAGGDPVSGIASDASTVRASVPRTSHRITSAPAPPTIRPPAVAPTMKAIEPHRRTRP